MQPSAAPRVSTGTDRAEPKPSPAAGLTVPRGLRALWRGCSRVTAGRRGGQGRSEGRRVPGGIARPGGCGGRACAPAPGEAEAAEGDPALGDRRGGGAGPGSAAPGAARPVSSPVVFLRGGREESPARPAGSAALPAAHPLGVGEIRRRGAVARVPLPPPPTPPRGRSEQEAAGRQKRTKEAQGVFRCRGRDVWAPLCARRSRVSAVPGDTRASRGGEVGPGVPGPEVPAAARLLLCSPSSACRRSPGRRLVAEYLFQRIYF